MGLMVGGRQVEGLMVGGRRVEAVMLAGDQIWPDPEPDGYVADWSSGWGPEWSRFSHVGAGSATASGYGYVSASGIQGATWMRLDDPDEFADFEMLVCFDTPASDAGPGDAGPGLAWRWNGTGSRNISTGYMLWARQAWTDIGILRQVSGSTQTYWTPSGWGTYNAARWVRIRMVGARIQMRWWVDGGSEPATWGFDQVDPSPVTSAGQVGLACFVMAGSSTRSQGFRHFEVTPL